jgi:hypothetical protein
MSAIWKSGTVYSTSEVKHVNISLDIPAGVSVVSSTDHKGNPVTYVEILGAQVLYASGHNPEGLDNETWENIFTTRLGYLLADLLLKGANGNLSAWTEESPTGRGVWKRDTLEYVRDDV